MIQDLVRPSTPITVPIRGLLGDYLVAPDGDRVAFLGLGAQHVARGLEVSVWTPPDEAVLIYAGVDTDWQPVDVVECGEVLIEEWGSTVSCGGFVMSSDWSQVAYSDGTGLWRMDFPSGTPERLLTHHIGDIGPGTEIYQPVSWSPDGAWLGLKVVGYEAWIRAVLNLETGELRELPDSLTGGSGVDAEMAWSSDSRYLAQTASSQGGALVLHDLATGGRRTLLDAIGSSADTEYHGHDPVFAADGSIRFRLEHRLPDAYRATGISEMSPNGSRWAELLDAPATGQPDLTHDARPHTVWARDGRAFVYFHDQWGLDAPRIEAPIVVGVDPGPQLYDAAELLGGADWVTWADG